MAVTKPHHASMRLRFSNVGSSDDFRPYFPANEECPLCWQLLDSDSQNHAPDCLWRRASEASHVPVDQPDTFARSGSAR